MEMWSKCPKNVERGTTWWIRVYESLAGHSTWERVAAHPEWLTSRQAHSIDSQHISQYVYLSRK